jgi:ribosome biogenesis GTPase A
VIPAKLDNQAAALKLAICDDIGEASYDTELVAAGLVDLLAELTEEAADFFLQQPLASRYELDPTDFTGEAYLQALADRRDRGDLQRTARQLLNDFRKGLLGAMPLELPPK